MNELSLGIWLRRERERRGVTLREIADQTKVAVPLLEGLEADDLSRWPAGIYRRAFVKSYATAVGLDAEEVVRRFEQEHPPAPEDLPAGLAPPAPSSAPGGQTAGVPTAVRRPASGRRARLLGTAADLTVAMVLGMGSAAAGSRLLWPVLLIALYYAVGVILTGTSPMVALLGDEPEAEPVPAPASAVPAADQQDGGRGQRPATPDRRPTTRRVSRAQRTSKPSRARLQ